MTPNPSSPPPLLPPSAARVFFRPWGTICAPDYALPPCDGCGGARDSFRYSVCMGCTKARARAAVTHRCTCRGSKRRPTPVLGSPRGRQWIGCTRCLGTIRQVA